MNKTTVSILHKIGYIFAALQRKTATQVTSAPDSVSSTALPVYNCPESIGSCSTNHHCIIDNDADEGYRCCQPSKCGKGRLDLCS